jgi:hypothetical protein
MTAQIGNPTGARSTVDDIRGRSIFDKFKIGVPDAVCTKFATLTQAEYDSAFNVQLDADTVRARLAAAPPLPTLTPPAPPAP